MSIPIAVTQFVQPAFFNMLDDCDKVAYTYLRFSLSARCNKNKRNKRIQTFTDTLEAIKRFAMRGDANDWKRCLVCGVCWLPQGLSLNTHQLRILIFKCKSSINGSLQKMGYTSNLSRPEATAAMTAAIPFLADHPSQLRQWTVRALVSQQPSSPPVVEAEPAESAERKVEINIGQPEDDSIYQGFDEGFQWDEDDLSWPSSFVI